MQVQVLGLQEVNGGPRGSCVGGAVGSEPRYGRIWSRQDVVNAELDLRLRFPLEGVGEGVVWLGAPPGPHRVQRAEGGVAVALGGMQSRVS